MTKSFKQFLSEMPMVTDAIKKIKINPLPKGSKVISRFGDYDVHAHPEKKDGVTGFSFVHRKSNKVHFQMGGYNVGNTLFAISRVVKHKDASFKAHDAYKHLMQHRSLISDESISPGAEKLYRGLAKDKDVHIMTADKKKTKITDRNLNKYLNSSTRLVSMRK